MKIICYFLLIICSLFACTKKTLSNYVDLQRIYSDTLLRIHNWYILAPFFPDSTLPVFYRQQQDLLLRYGKKEGDMRSLNDFLSFGNDIHKEDTAVMCGDIYMPLHMLDLTAYITAKPPVTAYMACIIELHDSCSAVIAMSAYQSCKLYLNGVNIYEVEWKRGRSKYREEFVPIKLKKGENFVLLKLTMSDTKYSPAQWGLEFDVIKSSFAKNLYAEEYRKHFIRRSLVEGGDTMKLYTGPYSSDCFEVELIEKEAGKIYSKGKYYAEFKNGLICIPLSKEMPSGLYNCKTTVSNELFIQEFFCGDIDKYFSKLKWQYQTLRNITYKEKLNVEGLIKRVYIDARRNRSDFDDQAEYWNNIRIPSISKLSYALTQLEHNNDPKDAYFLRGYNSKYYNNPYYYSAYLPPEAIWFKKLPVFIMLEFDSESVNDWSDHWRNYTASGIDEITDMADELGFIAIWTNCGGGNNKEKMKSVFAEIIDEVLTDLPANSKQIYVIGNCASTSMALELLSDFPDRLAGSGFVNPVECPIPYFRYKNNHRLAVLFSYYDEKIPKEISLNFYDSLLQVNSGVKRIISYSSTHYNCRANYMKPLFEILMSSK